MIPVRTLELLVSSGAITAKTPGAITPKSDSNTEMTLIHLFALLTGARIQTVLTVRAEHVMRKPGEFHGDDIRLACGPGTGIDTKGGVKGVLHLPRGFYERLYVYVHSDRARKRRQMADGGDHPDQPLVWRDNLDERRATNKMRMSRRG